MGDFFITIDSALSVTLKPQKNVTLGAKGDYGWIQRKDARTQRVFANESLRPSVFTALR